MAKMLAILKWTQGTEHEYGQLRPNADPRERAARSCGRYLKELVEELAAACWPARVASTRRAVRDEGKGPDPIYRVAFIWPGDPGSLPTS